MLVSELESAPPTLRTSTDAPAAPSVSPISTGPIASGNAQDQDEENDERFLRPKRLTVVEKLANSADTQVRPPIRIVIVVNNSSLFRSS